MSDFLWTEQADRLLREHTGVGYSASEIANIISPAIGRTLSRNAIIGRQYRLGLSKKRIIVKRPDKIAAKITKGGKTTGAINGGYGGLAVRFMSRHGDVPPPPPGGEIRDLPPETETRPLVKLLDLEPCHCRWPIGNPRSADFGFCGADRESALTPYCEKHHKIASPGRVKAESLLG